MVIAWCCSRLPGAVAEEATGMSGAVLSFERRERIKPEELTALIES